MTRKKDSVHRFGYMLALLTTITGCVANNNGGETLLATGGPTPMTSSGASPNPGSSPTASGVPSPPAPGPATSPNPNLSPSPNASGNVCAGAFGVCDDFETQAAGQSPNATWWTVQTQNANESITIDATRAYSGHQSLHFHTTNSGYERAMIVNTSIFPAANNTFFGRMFFYLEGDQPQTHFNLVDASGMLPNQTVPTHIVYGGQIGMFLANYYNNANPSAVLDLWQHAGLNTNNAYTDITAVPTNRWACLEWQFKGNTNEMHMWLDGNAVDRMTLVNTSSDCCPTTVWTQPPFNQVALGWTIVANQESFDHFDYWLDAVALDSNRIGCTP
jgi:hypothetical protein